MVLGAGVGGPPRARWWRRPVAFGPAIAVRRDVYERIGGHAGVRAEVAEDLALARAADRAGVTVRSTLGGDLVAYRMYPEGLRSLIEGWSKNLATGAGATPPLRLAATVAWVAGALQAPLLAVSAPSVVVLLASAAFAVQVAALLPRVGRVNPLVAVAYPAVLAAFLVLFARSVVLTTTRRAVPWRGRQVAVRG
jgi:4,4'-diaponeurosporenoate glycosyltransferase